MSREIINSITNTEEEAEQIKTSSLENYKQMVSNANVNANKILEKTVDIAQKTAKDIKTKAEFDAHLLAKKIKSDTTKECKQIIETSSKNLDNAVNLIIGRMVREYGCS